MSRLDAWLNSSGKSPAKQALKVLLREELARTAGRWLRLAPRPLHCPPHPLDERLRFLHDPGAARAGHVVILEGALFARPQAVHQVGLGGLLWVGRAAVEVEHDLRIIADGAGPVSTGIGWRRPAAVRGARRLFTSQRGHRLARNDMTWNGVEKGAGRRVFAQ